ncbi:MAG: D-glycero-beta-D-manno-heptose-7-phosphate kinase [Selenomonadaceae bacterium]|nr:D-glycero-beta-D-manno-heptose-7-phosphate kinase [Selenomonadaceae bacterium]
MKQAFNDNLKDFIANKTGGCKILVVGDVMLDKYYYGEVTRISPEAPVPITHVLETKETLGGAANVAHNLALLGCQTSIAGFVGDDYHGETLVEKLLARDIDYFDLVHLQQPTTTKIRIIGGHQQMLRLDFEDATPIVGDDANNLLENIQNRVSSLRSVDSVIISDYGKGTCTEETCQKIIKMCRKKNIPVVVDPKGSQWSKYSGASFITPNLKELNDVLTNPIKNTDKEVELAARYVTKKFNIGSIIVTRSDRGLTIVDGDKVSHIKAKAQEVFDVSGAGDTVIAVFTMAIAGKMDSIAAAYLANLAAGIVVAKVGTYAVSREELFNRLNDEGLTFD